MAASKKQADMQPRDISAGRLKDYGESPDQTIPALK